MSEFITLFFPIFRTFKLQIDSNQACNTLPAIKYLVKSNLTSNILVQ